MKVTLFRMRGKKRTAKIVDIDDIAVSITNGEFAKEVGDFRSTFPYLNIDKQSGRLLSTDAETMNKVPRICFASEITNRNHLEIKKNYNALVLLELSNITEFDEVNRLRDAASQLPQTMMAFVSASGRSLHVVCRAEPADGNMPQSEEEQEKFQLQAYKKAHKVYSSQLDMPFDNVEPASDQTCMISVDPNLRYRPTAIPFYISKEDDDSVKWGKHSAKKDAADDETLLPGYNRDETNRYVFQRCLSDAFHKTRLDESDERVVHILTLLAHYCHESGLPMEMCIRHTAFNPDIGKDDRFVREVFSNAYNKDLTKTLPLKHIPQSTYLTYKTEMMLRNRYELRRNVITDEVQFRHRDGFNYSFKKLEQRDRNDMTIAALKEGLSSWDKDIDRILNSSMIELYNPIEDYLTNLPQWDSTDRITELALRIPTQTPNWVKNFHTWLLGMVAQWMARDSDHGNAIMPLLIGYQGCGKTSFCKMLMPPELMEYYNNKINFENENAVLNGLARFGLINIDEFDSLSPRQMPLVKYFVQTSEVKIRRSYSQSIDDKRRYASFIGTTNDIQPLTDDTGSRRFVCVLATGKIDTYTPVNHSQLYAQALYEILNGARYWFNEQENDENQEYNLQFTRQSNIAALIDSIYRKPGQAEESEYLFAGDIAAELKKKYPNMTSDGGTVVKIGRYMKQQSYETKEIEHRAAYRIIRR